jgi:hypothetical protein
MEMDIMKTENETLGINEPMNDLNIKLYDNRESILIKLDEVIDFLYNKSLNGRITKPESDKVKISWFKALAYTCSIYSQIKRDVDLDEIKDKIETMNNEIKKLNEARDYEKEY